MSFKEIRGDRHLVCKGKRQPSGDLVYTGRLPWELISHECLKSVHSELLAITLALAIQKWVENFAKE